MSRVPFTLRIDQEERIALEHLSKIAGRPINQLLNEAIKNYLSQQGARERSLEASLAGLQAYRKQDPGFKAAIAAFAEAEGTLDDPIEGMPVKKQLKPADPAQRRMRKQLRA